MKMLPYLIAALVVVNQPANAIVSVGNGNYFTAAVDLVHEANNVPYPIKIQRTYNSRTQYEGIFGFGWGSDFESYLIPQADGSVVVQEAGGGDRTRFSPKEFSKEDVAKHIEILVTARAKQKGFAIGPYRARLLSDANFRDEETRTLGLFPAVAENTKLYTTQRGDKQTMTAIKEGFLREYASGRLEYYTQRGSVTDQGVGAKRRVLNGVFKPTRFVDPAKNYTIFYVYDNKGRLSTITDKRTQTIRLTYNGAGKVVEAIDSKGKKATYRYCESPGAFDNAKKCGAGDLVEVKTADPTVSFAYQYDNLHNLARVQFADGKTDEIAYWPPAEGGGVKSFKGKDGILTEYSYWKDPKGPSDRYKTTLKTTFSSGRSESTSYEYFDRARADGSRYRYKMIATVDGEVTETIYNECCGQPIQIKAPGGETKFEYFAGSGLPKEKNTPTETVQWEYHPKFHGKITKVTVMQKGSNSAKSSMFTYDEKSGQLKVAKTSDGRGVALAYDDQGRIKAMVDQDKRQISFKYGTDAKPAEIVQDGVGSIKVSYDAKGQIKNVESKGGRQISMSVAASFQNLLEIIRPAGVQPL